MIWGKEIKEKASDLKVTFPSPKPHLLTSLVNTLHLLLTAFILARNCDRNRDVTAKIVFL